MGNVRLSYFKNSSGSAEVLEENNYYPFGMKHEGYNPTVGNPAYKYQYNGKELQIETGNYAMDWRSYMPDLGRFSGMDMLSESYQDLTPYHFAANNPIMFSDPTGMYIKESNGSFSTTNLDEITELKKYFAIGGSVDNMDKLVADNSVFKVDIPGATISAKGNEHTWNLGNNFAINSYLMMSKFTGAQGDWNLYMNRARFYDKVVETGADKVERNFYLMFGGALIAPFAGSYIATLGGETAASYLQGALIRGVTDMTLQQTIKGSIDWKQTTINAFVGGGSGLGGVKVNWLNYGGNMINNFGTSYYDGGKKGFLKDFGTNSAKALTGMFGMAVGNYNGLTNSYLSGYFGTTLLPGLYFNTTDVVIENKINRK